MSNLEKNIEEDDEYVPEEGKRRSGINDVAEKFIADLIEEKDKIGDEFPIISLVIDEAIEKIEHTGRIPGKEFKADVYNQKPIKVSQTVFVPVKEFPKFNFTGKILGPKGNTLKRLQQDTKCKITIKGRNSMRDRAKEEECRKSGDPRYAHLNKNLYLVISTVGPPAESYARVAYALAEIRKYLVPDKNDDVSQQQLHEIMNDPELSKENAKQIAYNKSRGARKGQTNSSNGFNKYMSLVKKSFDSKTHGNGTDNKREYEQHSDEEAVMDDEEEEEQQYTPSKKNAISGNKYVPSKRPSRFPQKRTVAPPKYTPQVKRVRGGPS